MDKIDAVEVLQALKPFGLKDVSEKTLRTRVNVARPVAHTADDFSALLTDLKAEGWIRTRVDSFRELQVSMTSEGGNALKEAGA
jgi:hypothetical protein